MGTGSCERALGLWSAVGKRRHSALHLSRSHAPPHCHTASPLLFVSHSPTLSVYLSLHFHIYCRNTAEIWGLHHRCSGGLRMAEGERKLREAARTQNRSFAIHAHKALLKGSGGV